MKGKALEEVVIRTPFIKLDSLLKFCGAAQTGGHAKELVQSGLVQVNGEICLQRGKKIYPGSIVGLENMEYHIKGPEEQEQ